MNSVTSRLFGSLLYPALLVVVTVASVLLFVVDRDGESGILQDLERRVSTSAELVGGAMRFNAQQAGIEVEESPGRAMLAEPVPSLIHWLVVDFPETVWEAEIILPDGVVLYRQSLRDPAQRPPRTQEIRRSLGELGEMAVIYDPRVAEQQLAEQRRSRRQRLALVVGALLVLVVLVAVLRRPKR